MVKQTNKKPIESDKEVEKTLKEMPGPCPSGAVWHFLRGAQDRTPSLPLSSQVWPFGDRTTLLLYTDGEARLTACPRP